MLRLLADASPPSGNPSSLLYIFAALLAGGVLQVVWQVYRRWRRGSTDDALEIAKAAQDQAQSSAELWTRYRVELEDAKAQLSEYLRELVSVNRELGAATARIVRLEQELHQARNDATQLRAALNDAIARRDELRDRVFSLQERIRLLEQPSADTTP
jgi:chromosome segregation ATPase